MPGGRRPTDRLDKLGSGPDAAPPGIGRSLQYSPFGGTKMNPAALKEQIEKGEYKVDPTAVADAMLRRLQAVREVQKECSYPDSEPPASVNMTPPEPSTTEPIHVRRVPRFRRPLSSIFAFRAGTHAHSS
jgi:Anti-sigma-28 factor, FlgM